MRGGMLQVMMGESDGRGFGGGMEHVVDQSRFEDDLMISRRRLVRG